MAIFDGELGLQFVTHLANHYTVPDLVRLAQLAADTGFKQIWVNDNIRYRGQMVVMTAIAARVPIRLGTAIMVPYFHNPLDVADSLAALSELCEGQEISIGIARGDLGQSPQHVQALKPVGMVSETVRFLRRALAGEEIAYSKYPFLLDFYRLNPNGKFRLAFKPTSTFKFYGGGNGPQALRMCGRVMDGLISSGTYIPMLKAGRLPAMLATADQSARETRSEQAAAQSLRAQRVDLQQSREGHRVSQAPGVTLDFAVGSFRVHGRGVRKIGRPTRASLKVKGSLRRRSNCRRSCKTCYRTDGEDVLCRG